MEKSKGNEKVTTIKKKKMNNDQQKYDNKKI